MSKRCGRVFLIDDNPETHCVVEMLVGSIGLDTKSYHRPSEFLSEFAYQGPGAIVSDLIMPEMTGIELLHRVKANHIFLPFIILTGHADIEVAVSAFKSGAFNFIEKPFSKNAFLTVILQAIEHSRSELILVQRQQELERRVVDLTRREAEVTQQMLSGASNKEIARTLGISHRTVEHHRQCALKKLGVHSPVELSALLLQTRLTHAPQNGEFGCKGMGRTLADSEAAGCLPLWLESLGALCGLDSPVGTMRPERIA